MKKIHLTIGILILVILVGGVFFTFSPLRLAGSRHLYSRDARTDFRFERKSPLAGEGNRTNEHLPISASLKLENGQEIGLRVANTPENRQQGLSGFKKLEPDEGMLFIFDEPGIYPFWMKDMNFSIDIIWLKKTGLKIDGRDEYKIVHIAQQVSPESFPEAFVSDDLADAVLEVNSNMVDVYNLEQEKSLWISF